MRLCAVLSATLMVAAAAAARADSPPELTLENDTVTVSGVSSGGFMANQFHVAHSSLIRGAGIVAGGLYGCAVSSEDGDEIRGSVWRALLPCMFWPADMLEPADRFIDKAKDYAARDWIDPLEGLKGDRVYLFSGRGDRVVGSRTVKTAAAFYAALGAEVVYLDGLPDTPDIGQNRAGHSWLVKDSITRSNPCGDSGSPYISDCDYDQAEAVLTHLYGPLAPRVDVPQGDMVEVSQAPYVAGGQPESIGMLDTAWLYVPRDCRGGAVVCRLHVALHGCLQSAEVVGDTFFRGAGLNEWADTNRIVVLYPQARSGLGSNIFNPLDWNLHGCWNWRGFSNDTRFPTRTGQQIRALKAMVDALLAGRRHSGNRSGHHFDRQPQAAVPDTRNGEAYTRRGSRPVEPAG